MSIHQINKKLLSATLLIVLSTFAMLVWHSMPIYPDEIAVRWLAGRYIQDYGIAQKLFHYCSANASETPVLFVLPALIFSWIDLLYSPVTIRIVPFLITLFAVTLSILLAVRKGNPYAAIIATTAFIGVAASGLVMARSEYAQLFNVACCFSAFYFIESESKSLYLRLGLIVILLISLLMSLYSHIQGLLFLPLTIFMLFQLLSLNFRKKPAFIIAFMFLLIFAYTTISMHKLSCAEHPEILTFMAEKVINLERIQSIGVDKYFWMEIKRYYLSFLYLTDYQVDYLPGIFTNNYIQQALLNALNFGIVVIVLLNLSFFSFIAGLGFVFLTRQLLLHLDSSYQSNTPKLLLESIVALMLIVIPVLFLFCYDADKNFYRSFFINFLIAVVLAVLFSRKFSSSIPTFFKLYFWMCGIVIVSSIVINFFWFRDKLDAGFQGPSISTKQDFRSISHDISSLARECSMDLTKGKVVVDDMTYDTLKSYSYLYPITYLQLSAILTNVKLDKVVEKINPNYILARCDSFRSADIYIQKSRGQICCQNRIEFYGK